MKKSIVLLIVLTFFPFISNAQRKADVGIIAGTDFYIGDINRDTPFLSPRYALGPVIRYNFNERFSLRFQGIYARLAGSEDPETNITHRVAPANFSVSFINFASQAEYNFFDYKTGNKPITGTPYIFAGVGYSVMLTSQTNTGIVPENHLTFPFGFGGKINLTNRLSAGLEWSMNKTLSDRTDGVISPLPGGEKLSYGNDWYSFLGLFITYKFFKFADDCPVYD